MKAMVTGGGGFLGKAIVRQLVQRDDEVISFSRGAYPDLKKLGVECFRGDLNNKDEAAKAARGCDTVFHVAAKAGIWGPYDEFYQTNVVGTENIIAACREAGVKRLVYTSSPSVVHGGGGVEGVDESEPYPDHFDAPYPETKAMAEQMVLQANDNRLATVALRPHLIWGPGDPNFIPRLVARGKAGKLRKLTGGPYLVDHVYIDNAAKAHLLAADRLTPGSVVAGKAYFITQDEPIDVGLLIDLLIGTAGVPPVQKTISPRLAYLAGFVFEAVYKTFVLKGEPPMTRFVARQLSTSHWFDITAAKKELEYAPEISTDEGLSRLKEYLRKQAEGKPSRAV